MKFLGTMTSPKDLATKEYVDSNADTFTTCVLPSFSAAGSQNVTVAGVTINSNPVLDIYIPTAADLATYAVDWAHIYRADTYDGGITFYSDGVVTGGETIFIKGY